LRGQVLLGDDIFVQKFTKKGSGLDLSVMTCYRYCYSPSAQN
jgi:hypothetical protein